MIKNDDGGVVLTKEEYEDILKAISDIKALERGGIDKWQSREYAMFLWGVLEKHITFHQ